jgi:hypothetical protein
MATVIALDFAVVSNETAVSWATHKAEDSKFSLIIRICLSKVSHPIFVKMLIWVRIRIEFSLLGFAYAVQYSRQGEKTKHIGSISIQSQEARTSSSIRSRVKKKSSRFRVNILRLRSFPSNNVQ